MFETSLIVGLPLVDLGDYSVQFPLQNFDGNVFDAYRTTAFAMARAKTVTLNKKISKLASCFPKFNPA
jgi:hypothetical protein